MKTQICVYMDESRQEGRLLQGARGERMCRKQASWNLNLDCNFVISLAVFTLGAHECIA